MKKLSIYAAAVLFTTSTAFTIVKNQDHSKATVNQVNGMWIFVDSRPADPFRTVGTVELKRTRFGEQYEPVRDALLKKVREQFPAANGAVIHFTNGGIDKADAIVFE